MHRRHTLKIAALLGVTLLTGLSKLGASEAAARNPYYRPIRYGAVNSGRYYWTTYEKRKLHAAMNVVAARMLNPQIQERALRYCRYFKFYRPYFKTAAQYKNFIRMQFAGLRAGGFPPVYVYAWNHSRFAGLAQTAEFVKVRYAGRRGGKNYYRVSGRFVIKISKYHVNKLSTNQLAGVIAHEMLHQMGHSHNKHYDDNMFITVFGDLVANNGRYVPRGNRRYYLARR